VSTLTRPSRAWLLPLLLVSAFLPYISKGAGIRVENLLGALAATWAGAVVLQRGRVRRAYAPLELLTAAILVVVVCSTVFSAGDATGLKSSIGRLDHYLRPLAVLLVADASLAHLDAENVDRLFVACGKLLLAALFLNTLVQFASLFFDIEPYVIAFRPSAGDATDMLTVAEMAAQNGRLVGIFNQPLEHGTAYAVGFLVWVELWRRRALSNITALGAGVGVFVGGVLALSKVFLLGGLPLGILLLLSGGVRLVMVLRVMLFAGLLVPALAWLLREWAGAESLLGLIGWLQDPKMLAYGLSGGRLGLAGSVGEEYLVLKTLRLFQQAPISGVGISGAGAIGDNEYLIALGEGGMVLLLLVLARQWLVVASSLRRWSTSPEARLLLSIGCVLIMGGMGGPVSGIPRCGTVLWVFIALLLPRVSSAESSRRMPLRALVPVGGGWR